MLKDIIYNAINSWITSAAGLVLGLPELWAGLGPMLDQDDTTLGDWGLIMKGAGILIVGLFARDWTKKILKGGDAT